MVSASVALPMLFRVSEAITSSVYVPFGRPVVSIPCATQKMY